MTDARKSGAGRSHWGKALLVAVLAGGLATFFLLDGPRSLDLGTVKAQREALRAFADAHLFQAMLLGFVIYVAVVALSLPGATVLSLAAGFVFGRWVGTLLVLIAATTGATIVFLAARYLIGDWARRRLGAAGARMREGFAADAFSYLLFLRLVPAFPFFLVNLAMAFAPIPTRTYVVGTLIGIVPGTFVFVNLGEALGRLESTRGLLSTQTMVAFGLFALLALAPVAARRLRRRIR